MMNQKRNKVSLWVLAILVLLLGAYLRFSDLSTRRFSPDDGNYLYSAQAHLLDRDKSFKEWVNEDIQWLIQGKHYYPHSYLHQLAARCLVRLGADFKSSIRIPTAFFGSLTPLAIFLFYVFCFPQRRWAGFFAASMAALTCIHVWYSRTGWGAISCTFFCFLYISFGYVFFLRIKKNHLKRIWLCILAMTLCSFLAYGFHEMVSPYIVGMGIYLLLHQVLERPNILWILRSQKTIAYVLSSLLVGGCTLFILFSSEFAQYYWFEQVPEGRGGFWAIKAFNFQALFLKRAIFEQIGYPVVALAAVGMFAAFRKDRPYFRYLVTLMLGNTLIFLMLFKDADLVRIYLPVILMVFLFAGEGTAFCLNLFKHKGVKVAGYGLFALLLAYLGVVSHQTCQGDPDHSFYLDRMDTVKGFEARDSRNVEAPVIDYLKDHPSGKGVVGVNAWIDKRTKNLYGEFSLLFYLLDAGIKAKPFPFVRKNTEKWPEYLIGVKKEMQARHRTTEKGGLYQEAISSTLGRFALYKKIEKLLHPSQRKKPK